ncbi:lipopolysaccharide biosynthesis protein [Fusobacterium russii]|uniref:lipopolysaccharide biosynthesis protein n=1 Tax=Fusobacterium russii TaxID=854 RepID=UPI0003A44DF5|nr:lipopolysaccharide biosynthesis protein [Fusobacterium russii]
MKEKIKKFLENNPKILKILKKDQRSYVFNFIFEDKIYVYKEPIEKNTRKWQKFLAIFRGRESKREFKQMEKINSLGLFTAKPVFYTADYLVYEFIEAGKADEKNINFIVDELHRIHSLGYLHGDSHIDNFLIDDKNKVYIIDSKFRKNIYGKFGEIFEFMYLEDSLSMDIPYNKNSIYYKAAVALRNYLTFYSKLKNFIRRK